MVAVSTGLLSLMSPRELKGVLAHEVVHLRNRDSALSLTAGILVQVIAALSQGFSLLLLLSLLSGALPSAAGGLLASLVLVSLAPLEATLLQAGLLRTRERLADREAARLTGEPRGLASALYRLHQYPLGLRGWLRCFCFLYAAEDDEGPWLLRTHPPTQERVRRLPELERELADEAMPAARVA